MKKAPTIANETQRLEALKKYNLLDTPPESCFDEITQLAKQICNTEIALISLVDTNRQWFKSKQNLDADETPRDISFCGHAIENSPPLIIEDAFKDQRFHDNPLVCGPPNVRFYAGAPLTTPDGNRIGTLCVIDSQPKKLNETQVQSLRLLANNVIQICELRFRNKELEESKRLMEDFQTTAQIGGWELDIATKETIWTKEIYKIYGIPEDKNINEIKGMSFYLEPSRSKLKECIENCITNKIPFNDFFEFKDSTGQLKWLQNRGRLITDNSGKAIKLVGTTQDVTKKILGEKEIINKRQFLTDTINNIPALFYNRSQTGDILLMNDGFIDFHKVKIEGQQILTDKDTFSEENYQTVIAYDQKVLETGDVIETEDTLLDCNDTKRIFNSFRFPYRDMNGDIYATGCISIDITNKKIIESQSLHKAKLASIGEMAAGAGHEINNPLAIIIGYVSKLKKMDSKNELTSEILMRILDGISKSAFRISKIVSGIRSFSRYDSEGTMDFDIVESIRESAYMVQEIYDGEGVIIEFLTELESNKYYVHGNRGQIQQVIINLISNARDATAKVIEPKILVECEKKEEEIIIQVQDNGSGIPEDIQSRIFDPFFTTKSAEKGTGIGLSLVNKLVNDHGGSIQLDSAVDEGTTFTIRLPIKEASFQVDETNHTEELDHLTTENPKRILLVDDEPEIRELLREILALYGYDVTDLGNGREAIELCKEKINHFDLILCDIRMPEMDGYMFFQELKKIEQSHPPKFVFITGGVNIELTAPMANIEGKVDGFLYKPFDHKQLLSLLQKVFDNTKNEVAS